MESTEFRVATTDGLELAARVSGPAGAPLLVCVHGFPDDSSVWDAVLPLLTERMRVVTYDVRGAGRSGAPETRDGYRLDQLAADLNAVIGAATGDDDPGADLHLLGHDWGSIQVWHAICGSGAASRAAGFTSISGPELGAAARWMRSMPLWPRLKQGASSWYIVFFHLPRVPELLLSSRWARRALGGPARDDPVRGLELYRANMVREMVRPRRRATSVPVRVVAPRGDRFVGVALQGSAADVAREVRFTEVDGSHWVVRSDPAAIADEVLDSVFR